MSEQMNRAKFFTLGFTALKCGNPILPQAIIDNQQPQQMQKRPFGAGEYLVASRSVLEFALARSPAG
jgi:hypothetical protein